MQVGKIIKISDISIEIILSSTNIKIGDILKVEGDTEEKYLFEDSEAESPICSYKQTTFCASMIASFISNLVVNHAANLNEEISSRDLPFFTYYNAAYMYLKTE